MLFPTIFLWTPCVHISSQENIHRTSVWLWESHLLVFALAASWSLPGYRIIEKERERKTCFLRQGFAGIRHWERIHECAEIEDDSESQLEKERKANTSKKWKAYTKAKKRSRKKQSKKCSFASRGSSSFLWRACDEGKENLVQKNIEDREWEKPTNKHR